MVEKKYEGKSKPKEDYKEKQQILKEKAKELYNLHQQRKNLYKKIYDLTTKINALEQTILGFGGEVKLPKNFPLVVFVYLDESKSYKKALENFYKKILEIYKDPQIKELYKKAIEETTTTNKKVEVGKRKDLSQLTKGKEILYNLFEE